MNLIFITVSAAVIGSFLNMIISRLPVIDQKNLDFWQAIRFLSIPRSKCDNCAQPLSIIMLIPLISYILQKGRCKFCDHAIGLHVPLVELLSVVLAIGLYLSATDLTQAAWLYVFFTNLLVLSIIDWQQQILPDKITYPLLWLGLWLNSSAVFTNLSDAVFGVIVGYGFLWGIYQLYFLLRQKEGLGFGDFKLMAAIGAWFGVATLPAVLFIASVLALIFALISHHPKDQPLAFGVFICIATVISYFTPATYWLLLL